MEKVILTCVFMTSLVVAPGIADGQGWGSKDAVERCAEQDTLTLGSYISKQAERSLPKDSKSQAQAIAQSIIEESCRYKHDPVLLMAVIANESGFRPNIVGKYGEIGLMQLKPSSARWIAQKLGIPWSGKENLKNTALNIKLGAAYLSLLKKRFNGRGETYLAAYNMGTTNVLRAQISTKEYPKRVMKHYLRYWKALSPHSGRMFAHVGL